MLFLFLPHSDKREILSSLKSAIIEPALSLAHKFHLSVDRFTVSWTPVNRTPPEHRSFNPADYSKFECVNLLQQGKVLKFPAATQGTAGRGHIVHLFDVSPGLVLEVVKGNTLAEPKGLNLPRILVAFTKEGQAPFRAPKMQPGEEATVLGWLEKRVFSKQERSMSRQY